MNPYAFAVKGAGLASRGLTLLLSSEDFNLRPWFRWKARLTGLRFELNRPEQIDSVHLQQPAEQDDPSTQ